MEKKLDVIQSQYLNVLIKYLNASKISREDLIAIYPPMGKSQEYVAIFYC